jgi:fructose/tagatose bisphosphate aldolase
VPDKEGRLWLRRYLETKTVLAFNFNELIELQGLVAGIRGSGFPVVAMVSQRALRFVGMTYVRALMDAARKEMAERIFLQFDHVTTSRLVHEAIESGFVDIVMADFSAKGFTENVAETAIARRLAEPAGVLIEAQLGHIVADYDASGIESEEPPIAEAATFIARTDVDLLALPFGARHGFARPKPALDFHYMKAACEELHVPLVLHGCDFVETHQLRDAVKLGVKKLNFGPAFRVVFVEALRTALASTDLREPDQRVILECSRSCVRELVERLVREVLQRE